MVDFYDFDGFRLEVRRRRLLRNGEPVALKPKALDTLLVLVQERGRVMAKDELMNRLWPDTVVEEANLTQNIFVVRKALGEVPGEQRFIATVARHGYRFVGEVAEVRAGVEPADVAVASTEGPRWRSWRVAAVLLVLAGVVGVVGTSWWTRAPRSSPAGPIRGIAVLPFRNLSSDPEQAYFADGITDAVITDLASISALRIVSHQSVRRYRNSAQPVAEIARELGVDAVVEGTVSRTERRIRVAAQLVDARSDQHLWAATYEREIDDVLTLQGELAGAVAGAVHVRVSDPERTALVGRRTVDPEAYDAYLRGRYFFAQRSESALRRSVEHYRLAIDRDPTFAPAHAGLALAYGPLGFFGYVPASEAASSLRASAERALRLDPTLVDAEVALAVAKVLYDWDWPGGERAYAQILERHPSHAQARLWYGFLLSHLGRGEDALVERERALRADPLSLQFNTSVADTLTVLGRLDAAMIRYRRTLELDAGFAGAHQGLGVALLKANRRDEAVRSLEEAVRVSPDLRSTAALGHAYGVVGRAGDARAILERFEARARAQYLSPIYLAFVHAGLGEPDLAFARIEQAFRDRSPLLTGAKIEPLLDPLRADPRFDDLLRRMNLPRR